MCSPSFYRSCVLLYMAYIMGIMPILIAQYKGNRIGIEPTTLPPIVYISNVAAAIPQLYAGGIHVEFAADKFFHDYVLLNDVVVQILTKHGESSIILIKSKKVKTSRRYLKSVSAFYISKTPRHLEAK